MSTTVPPVDPIASYIASLRAYLPPAHREVVGRTIEDEMRAQVAATESHTRQVMTPDEIEALLRMRGHPYLLAQPYRTGRYLFIGPSLLPQYRHALRVAITLAFFAIVAVAAVLAAAGTAPGTVAQAVSTFLQFAFYIVVIVTLTFAVVDILHGRMLLKHPWALVPQPAVAEPSTRATGHLGDVATAGVFLVWWLTIPHFPWVLLGPGARYFAFSAGWHEAYWPVTTCFAVALLVQAGAVIRRKTVWLTLWRGVIASAASLIGTALLLDAGDLLIPSGIGTLDLRTTSLINHAVRWCLLWTMVVAVVQMVRDSARALRRRREASAA